jgi:hypothetical protein
MKKIIFLLVVLSLLVPVSMFAEEAKKEEMPGMSMHGGGRMGGPPQSQMVATNDGGVIVLMGPKLMKYDADLNLVKEVEVKMPKGPMGDKQYSMMGKMNQDTAPAVAESQEKLS